VAVYVRLGDGAGRLQGNSEALPPPLEGDPERMAEELLAYAASGISEVQLVMDPISAESITEFARVFPVLEAA
jgi:hypothetical protein